MLLSKLPGTQYFSGCILLREITNWYKIDVIALLVLDHDDILDGNKKPSAKITAVEAAGKDFEGYFVRGWVQDSPILTDYGPKDAVDGHEQLSPNQPLGSVEAITRMINENRTIESNIINKAEDGKYDVYLWMKNDITHSFADNYDSSMKIEQQFINLEILPE